MILNVIFSEKDWRKNWNKNIRLHKKKSVVSIVNIFSNMFYKYFYTFLNRIKHLFCYDHFKLGIYYIVVRK